MPSKVTDNVKFFSLLPLPFRERGWGPDSIKRGTLPRNIVGGTKINPEKLRLAKEFRRHMTPGENLLWNCLRTNQFKGYHFRRQQIINGFIADFYCHSAELVIEVDGGIHETQKESDTERDQAFFEHGIRVLRVRDEEVMSNISLVLEKIAAALSEKKS